MYIVLCCAGRHDSSCYHKRQLEPSPGNIYLVVPGYLRHHGPRSSRNQAIHAPESRPR